MRKIYPYGIPAWILLTLLLTTGPDVWGQACTNTMSGTSCTRSNFFFGEILPNNGCGTFNTATNYSPGEYFRMPVLSGGCYTISTCGNTINTQVSAYQGTLTTGPYAFNDDNGPDCSGGGSNNNASIVIVPNFTDYTRVSVREFNCQPGGSQSITVKVRQNNNLTITSSSADMCAGDTRALTATPAPVSGAQPNSGDQGTFSGTGVAGTTFTAPTPSGASQTFTITYNFGYCSTTQQITVFADPSAANAGGNQTVCSGTATLAAASPAVGTGTWSVVSGPGTVTNPNSPSSTVTGLTSATPTVLQWTVSNGPCNTTFDQITITRDEEPTTANAGVDQSVCADTTTIFGNPAAVGAGVWTLVGGSGTISSPTNPSTDVTGLGIGANTFRWTISNGVCPPSTDDVVITRDPLPTLAAAGADQSICDTITNLAGNAPSVGVGTWAIVSGSGAIGGPNNPNSALDSIGVGTTVLTWTISSGACPPSVDTIVVVRNAPPANPSVAGSTILCAGSSTQLIASSNASNPSFLWWDAETGGNTLAATSAFNTGPLTATDTFYVTVTDGVTGCTSDREPVAVTVLPAPPVNLGPDTSICSNDTLCLDAGANQSGYIWSNSSFGQTICVNSPGIYWVIVTDSSGCQNSDSINLGNFAIPSVNLGPDQEFCSGDSLTVGVGMDTNSTYLWNTGDTSSMITVAATDTLELTVTNSDNCAVSDSLIVTQLAIPTAAFSVDSSNCPLIQFNDNSIDGTAWSWDFGDGSAGSTAQSPLHNYGNSQPGTYNVSLTVTNLCGTDSTTIPVDLSCIVGLEPLMSDLNVLLYPNPTSGLFRVEFSNLMQKADLEVFDISGKRIWAKDIDDPQGEHEEVIDLSGHASGVYMVRLTVGNYQLTKRVVLE